MPKAPAGCSGAVVNGSVNQAAIGIAESSADGALFYRNEPPRREKLSGTDFYG
jgi:hypothetical protein